MNAYSIDAIRSASESDRGREYISAIAALYNEKFKGKPISELTHSDYALYETEGNRRAYEAPYFERRERLSLLEVLAVADEEYVGDLEEIIKAICDESTWLVPAHAYAGIDLFATETAAALAETYTILSGRLSDGIRERIMLALNERIVRIYENGSFWWENAACNWSSVCAAGIGITYMLCFSERAAAVMPRLIASAAAYLESLDGEGYCYEGVNYWQYGFANFCRFFLAYSRFCGKRHPLSDSPKAINTLAYLENSEMDGNVYLPFADGGFRRWCPCSHYMSIIAQLYPDSIMPPKHITLPFEKGTGLEDLCCIGMNSSYVPPSKQESTYYERAEVFISRKRSFSFAVKCGSNAELHNHNDIGAFQIVSGGRRLICDVGAGNYTKEYFGTPEQRYSIFACSSLAHSVPIVDGKLQSYGENYRGRVLAHDESSVRMNLAGAYSDGPQSLIADYRVNEEGVTLSYSAKGVNESIIFHFVSDVEPVMSEGQLLIGNMRLSTDLALSPTVRAEKYLPHYPTRGELSGASEHVAYIIEYAITCQGKAEASFSFDFKE